MGFKVGRTFSLEFEGTEMHGAIVKIRSAPVSVILDLLTENEDMSNIEIVKHENEVLAERIVSWNLEDEDGPIEISAEGLLKLEEPVRDLIFKEWLKATRGITAPLEHRSSDGEKSPEESIPMETL